MKSTARMVSVLSAMLSARHLQIRDVRPTSTRIAMPADKFSNRLPQNVPGRFYVDDQCLDCDLCRETAPTVFRRDHEMGVAYIYRQPESEEELSMTEEAIQGCPCEAIFSDGDQFDWTVPRGTVLPAWLCGEAP